MDFSLKQRKPFIQRNRHTTPNINIVSTSSELDHERTAFVDAIGHSDDRYRDILDLYVAPREYPIMLDHLENSHILFIIGDPGIGKTYSSIRLLKHYFDAGYKVVWHEGSERTDRLTQRALLENFSPIPKHTYYFEDPFGRITFEDRDSLCRAVAPLIDASRDIDTRVIITSRREVFEQFSQMLPQSTIGSLTSITTDLSIISPSYSADALIEVLNKISKRCIWSSDDTCRNFVHDRIVCGHLATPLAIRDFVHSTELVDDLEELSARLNRRQNESTDLFAEEITASPAYTRACLSMVFLCGHRPLSSLTRTYSTLVRRNQSLENAPPFPHELRHQMGFRIERYGARAKILRFIHPQYEEAFARSIISNIHTRIIVSDVMRELASENIRTAVQSVARFAQRYSPLAIELYNEIAPLVRATSRLSDFIYCCSQLLTDYARSGKDPGYLHVLSRVCDFDELSDNINECLEPNTIAYALRFFLNYRRNVSHSNPVLSIQVDWDALKSKLMQERQFAPVAQCLESGARLNRDWASSLLISIPDTQLIQDFVGLSDDDKNRFIQLLERLQHWTQRKLLVANLNSTPRDALASSHIAPSPHVISIDDGAWMAISDNRSLLPIGITGVTGKFERGMLVMIKAPGDLHVGDGYAAYSSNELQQLKGLHSSHIEHIVDIYNGASAVRQIRVCRK